MIAAWMLLAVVVSGCLYVAGRTAERALGAGRGRSRWVWAVGSLLVALRYGRASRRLAATLRSATTATVAGEPVLMVRDGAPALVGVVAPRIVVPAWLTEFDAALQALVIAHEAEHRRAGDVWLVHGLALLLIALPWNVPLWLMGRRLRRAIELDCDARVLARHPDVQRYGRVLLTVAQRRGLGASLIAPALAEPVSLTEERIMALTTTERLGTGARAALVLTALAAVVAACTAERGTDPAMADAARTTAAFATEVAPADTVLKEFQVDVPVQALPGSPGPVYPAAAKARREEGMVLVQFVIRADSSLDLGSVRVVSATSEAFADAVRTALPTMQFRAGEVDGKPVAQMVQQPFGFQLPR